MDFFSTNQQIFKDYSDDITADLQDCFNDMLTATNDVIGHMKNRPTLTLPYGCDKIDIALENFYTR